MGVDQRKKKEYQRFAKQGQEYRFCLKAARNPEMV